MPSLFLSKNREILHDGTRRLEPKKRVWASLNAEAPNSDLVSPADAVRWLYREANAPQVPVGVIGPRDATERQITVSEQLGKRIGELSIPLINGGKNGVMEAVSKGCAENGGTVIGVLPDGEWAEANQYVTIPIATGFGKARNVLIAQACLALVAVGGEYGTLSEMAFGLHFDKPVFTLEGAPEIEGVRSMESVDEVMNGLISVILQLPDGS